VNSIKKEKVQIKAWKLVVGAVLVAVLVFLGFWGMVIAAFAGGTKFYMPLEIAVTAALILLTLCWPFGLLKKKKIKIGFAVFFTLCALAVMGYEIHRGYINSLGTVNEQGVNLSLYQPFKNDSKIARLNEPADLKITNPFRDRKTAAAKPCCKNSWKEKP